MPLIAIAGAIIADVIAAPIIGGLLAGATLASVGGLAAVLTVTAAVGATLGAVGAITKDKGLQTAGLIIGGIGAVGSLANAAGLFGDTSNLFGALDQIPDSVAITGPVQGAASGGAELSSEFATGSAGLAGASSDYINMFTPQSSFSNIPDGATVSIDETGNVVVGTPDQLATSSLSAQEGISPATTAPNPSDLAAQASRAVVQPGSQTTATTPLSGETASAAPPAAAPNPAGGSGVSGVSTPAAPGSITSPTSTAEANKGIFDSLKGVLGSSGEPTKGASGLLGFLKDNPTMSYGLIQAAGSAFSSLPPAQAANQRAQANLNNEQSLLTQQQLNNIKSGIPQAKYTPVRSAPVTGAPASLSPTGPANNLAGIINSNTVTGVPA